jgi:hypothetical protein
MGYQLQLVAQSVGKAEYETAAASGQLALARAVVVQPLSTEQVHAYLMQGGKPGAALRTALREHPILQELATTPLTLNILILTYQGHTIKDLPLTGPLPDLQRRIFAAYVARMLQKKLVHPPFPHLIPSLSWLAKRMREQRSSVFFIEYLNPVCLPRCLQRIANLITPLLFVLTGICANLLLSCFISDTSVDDRLPRLHLALLGGFVGLRMRPSTTEAASPPSFLGRGPHLLFNLGVILGMSILIFFSTDTTHWQSAVSHSLGTLLSSILFQLSQAAFPLHPHPQASSARGLQYLRFLQGSFPGAALGIGIGLTYGLIAGGSAGLTYGLRSSLLVWAFRLTLTQRLTSLHFAERLHWNWQGFVQKRHLQATFKVFGQVLFFFGFCSYVPTYILTYGWMIGLKMGMLMGGLLGLSFGLLYWFLLGLGHALEPEHLDDKDRFRFNQGIHRSWCWSLVFSSIGTPLIVVIAFFNLSVTLGLNPNLSLHWSYHPEYGWSAFWMVVITAFVVLWIIYTGSTILRHYVIRALLASYHLFPWHAKTFLDDANSRVLLRRVGGGYSFLHRLLLDYFADLPDTHQDHTSPPSPPD